MQSKRGRLDRYLCTQLHTHRKAVRELLLLGRVRVDGLIVKDMDRQVDEFSHIQLDGQILQANTPVYLMLHKPIGVVSATKDTQHKTVIDLLDCEVRDELHIAGRLDLNSSGLLLLTNDSRWSDALMSPTHKVDKVYRVTLANPLTEEYIAAFAEGMYFSFEDIMTQPAKLVILADHVAEVTLKEGKYHQIKRMFGRFRNPVVGLHRLSIGDIVLDEALASGESRVLTAAEVACIRCKPVA
ncbi:MAG: 16S rRNA pseudouridine(516) synthase [Shewanella sp.]|uniref:pseudouridine synthase n=1 Tax=unclassified Shewanella TaxID=196818 RepID=UPI0021D98566|nr:MULTISPECIES: 16S rRNA pseudouridine(516) synthase [unclassified Shewanella]MCU8035601.1 16S rRNA pseudouridine(516) synthase [Shewanella sp. SM71]MCU8058968.1 16S rRNA pseudouridine(516) synthase [Shewanella sp. SM35]MCU8067885.1 16S rRNA pseudouridine(516) synthase [Shewanella sp. SM34]MCU8097479.1 16S rRNA pseudouridine(516) synthase [Shewanella sp. SM102]